MRELKDPMELNDVRVVETMPGEHLIFQPLFRKWEALCQLFLSLLIIEMGCWGEGETGTAAMVGKGAHESSGSDE